MKRFFRKHKQISKMRKHARSKCVFLRPYSVRASAKNENKNERGVAMAMAIIIVAILSVVALTALAFSSTEVRIAASDLQRSQAFYASVSSMEKMTNDFSNLFRTKMRPTAADLNTIVNSPPAALATEGFDFQQTLEEDMTMLDKLRAIQGLSSSDYPRVNIPEGAFAGLYATIIPYKMSSTATNRYTKTQVELEREFNNYLVPLFQFGIFSNEDLEFTPGPAMTFNGRIHSNGNIYALRNITFLNRLTMAGELVRETTSGGQPNNQTGFDNVWINIGGTNVQINKGSVQSGSGTVGGPNILGSTPGTRGFYPGSPNGVANPNWEATSIKPANGTADQYGGQILTNTTGANELNIPLQLEGNSPAEIIKRALPSDSEILAASRYQNKATVRITIDDETAGSGAANVAGIPAGEGVLLSTFTPSVLNGGTNTLRMISDGGTISGVTVQQKDSGGALQNAMTVRGVKGVPQNVGGNYIPSGSGIKGRILIEIVKPDGTSVDVTQQILSMGVTEGEPNGIVYLQRPLFAAAVQGSRDRSGNGFDLVSLTRNSQLLADGEIKNPAAFLDASRNFISGAPSAVDDDPAGTIVREAAPSGYNIIVPINVYNVREGWVRSTLSENNVYYERGITSVVELNMRNLSRWLDGVYDANLLSGTNAVSANIKGDEGYVVYVSDRRGDKIKTEYLSDGTAYKSTNGTVDNEDIYGPNGTLDAGEDVIDFGWTAPGVSKKGILQHDTSEIPDTGNFWTVNAGNRVTIGMSAMSYQTNFFRRSVRLFDGERLSVSGASGKLSPTKGITVASENMIYVWGNYNTTGITSIPADGSTLNDGGYTGPQVPASIACDAIFPLSKTWFDGLSAMFPEGSSTARSQTGTPYRMADENLTDVTQSTSVRAGTIAGTNISALSAAPGRDAANSRRSGGVINFPRFLELWNLNGTEKTWNYAGSFVPLYHSTQALSQWENTTSIIYMPPRRNWSFDQTFLNPNQLPPGTPFFQYVQATGFRQKLHD
ncbi:MAG: hypothetical protein ACR2N3_17260 [Pyrinomonadaceae bacterium]